MRFVSHEVWPDKGCVIRRFLHCRVVQIVSLWSLSTWIRIVSNTNESIDWINAEIKCPTGDVLKKLDFLVRKNAPQSKTYETKCAAGKICVTESWWIVCPVYVVCYLLYINHRSETYLFDELMNKIIHPLIKLGQAQNSFVCHTGDDILLKYCWLKQQQKDECCGLGITGSKCDLGKPQEPHLMPYRDCLGLAGVETPTSKSRQPIVNLS